MKLILGGIAIFLWGLFMLLRPSTCWNLFESWKNNGNTGPSKFYLIDIRISGGICMVVGLALMACLFFL